MLELLPVNTTYNFLGKAKYAYLISGLLALGSIYLWFAQGEAKYGVDYRGGIEFIVDAGPTGTSSAIQAAISKTGIGEPVVQSFERGSNEYSVRLGGRESTDLATAKTKVEEALKASFGESAKIVASDYVGPTVGKELRRAGAIAMALGLLVILVYVAFRFEFALALGAVVAVFHDVIIATGAYLLVGHPLSMGSLAAALTIIGYSVNDTIVLFDRVRDEFHRNKGGSVTELFNRAINFTLSRTVITHLLTLFSAAALWILGGGAIRDLSFFLLVGIVVGIYSTIYIASPVAIAWHRFRGGEDEL